MAGRRGGRPASHQNVQGTVVARYELKQGQLVHKTASYGKDVRPNSYNNVYVQGTVLDLDKGFNFMFII